MLIRTLDSASIASGIVNEDRCGTSNCLAWVIDGATDVGTDPVTGAASDASWFADEVHRALVEQPGRLDLHADPGLDLAELPARLADHTSAAFAAVRRREPEDRFEYPSASGVVVRASATEIQFVSVGDCTLILAQAGAVTRLGADLRDAGDQRLAAAIANFQKTEVDPSAESARRHVWPAIKAQRNKLNTPSGYGVLSIVPPPPAFVRTGRVEAAPGARLLLASDGLMRLVDVYRVMTVQALVEAAQTKGLAALCNELRRIEAADSRNFTYPRAKTSDDATGLLLETGRS